MTRTVRFGSYELLSLLGKGGMARVFRAARSGPHGFSKEVALKVLDPTATATPDQIAGLTDEARLGGLLRHQNIVATDELGQVGPYYYIAMELVDGWPLDRLLEAHRERGVPVPRSVILDVLIEVCTGLAYAHELTGPDGAPLGLVHRDMKPGNIMISRRGEVKIMDFGIAKATTNIYMTQAQTTRGTPLFMSPEQVMGQPVDARSDLFSLGGVLCELCTLAPTFDGQDVVPVLRAVLAVEIGPAIDRIRAAFPQILPIFLRCMQELPDERYPNARAVRRDLEALRDRLEPGLPVERWVKQLAPGLKVTQTGELGDVLPGGLALPSAPGRDGGVDTISLPHEAVADVASSFEMPLGPGAPPPRGVPHVSGPVDRQVMPSAPNLAAVPPRVAARPSAPPRPAPLAGRAHTPPAPKRRPSPSAQRAPTWQRRAARKAAMTRLLTLAAVALAALFLGTFAPGPWGDFARSTWGELVGWIRPLLGL